MIGMRTRTSSTRNSHRPAIDVDQGERPRGSAPTGGKRNARREQATIICTIFSKQGRRTLRVPSILVEQGDELGSDRAGRQG